MGADRIIFVGGGGFCRELMVWASDCVAAGTLPPFGGYIDDEGDMLSRFKYDLPYLGAVQDYAPQRGDNFILAIGSPQGKRAVHAKLKDRGGTFPRLLHPTARVAPTASLGEGVILLLMAVAGPESRIDRFVTLNGGSGVGHDGVVGEFTTISSHVDVTGGAQLGRDLMVGSKSLFLPGVKVGDGARIGAGSIVYRNVPAGATTFAAPARQLRMRS